MPISINGASLATAKVVGAKLTLRNSGIDVLQLETSEPVDSAPQWPRGTTITINSGTTVFVGTVAGPRAIGRGAANRRTYQVLGGGWWLRLPFLQPWLIWDHAATSPPDAADPAKYREVPIGLLFGARNTAQFPAVGVKEKGTAITISDAVARAVAAGAPVAAGAITADLAMPPTRVDNQSCEAIITQCVRRCFDACAWWDYSSGTAALNAQRYGELAEVTVRTDGTAGSALDWEVEEVWGEIVGARIFLQRQVPRKIVMDGVTATFPIATGEDPVEFFSPDVIEVTSGDVGSEFSIVQAVARWSEDFTATECQEAANFLVAAANNIRHRVKFTVRNTLPTFTIHPGVRLSLSGQYGEWASMGALVQEVTHDLLKGTTTGSAGPADHLGFSEISDWLRFLRARDVSRDDRSTRDDARSEAETYGFGKGREKDKEAIASIGVSNLGSGEGEVLLDATKTGQDFQITARSIKAGENVTVTQDGIDITISAPDAGGDITLAASNIGSGEGEVLLDPSLDDGTWTLYARNIAAGQYVSVTQDTTDITLDRASITTTNSGSGYQVLKAGAGQPAYDAEENQWTLTGKSLVAGTNLTITDDGDALTLNATGELTDVVIETANVGSGAGEVLLDPALEDNTWTIFARNIAAGQYVSVTQDTTDITLDGAALSTANTGGYYGVLKTGEGEPAYDSGTKTWTISARTLRITGPDGSAASDWLTIDDSDPDLLRIQCAIPNAPGGGSAVLVVEDGELSWRTFAQVTLSTCDGDVQVLSVSEA